MHWVDFLRLGFSSLMGSRASAGTSQDLGFLICAMGRLDREEHAEAFQSDLL